MALCREVINTPTTSGTGPGEVEGPWRWEVAWEKLPFSQMEILHWFLCPGIPM